MLLTIYCHITPLTFILQCKLDSVLSVILIKFYVMLCYVMALNGLFGADVPLRNYSLTHFVAPPPFRNGGNTSPRDRDKRSNVTCRYNEIG